VLLQSAAWADWIKHDTFGQRFAPAAIAALVAFLAGVFSQFIHITQRVITKRSLSDPDRFEQKFGQMVAAVERDRLVIAVDNLDRTSPEKAVEILSTIKTYLEPALDPPKKSLGIRRRDTVAKQVCFLIAVDDAALRRHLLAQELGRSDDPDRESALRYVDEYLAKFFSARLPIRAILPDDMRSYIAEYVGPFVRDRGHKADETQLVSLISAGLRHNPRRIKQFINDLEARLRLIQEREESKAGGRPAGIAPAVSGELLMVAKLALIEAEWPEAFDQLRDRPSELQSWQAEAQQNDEVWVTREDGRERPEKPTPEAVLSAARFGAFLRASSTIESPHMRAIINLKQAPDESGLPGFGEFREAIVNADREAAARILDGVEEDQRARYASRLPAILQEELRGTPDLDAARGVVDAAISLPELREVESARHDVLRVALDTPTLKAQLRLLDAAALTSAAQGMPDARRQAVYRILVDHFAEDGIDARVQTDVSAALTDVADDLGNRLVRRLREVLASDERAGDFSVYVDLAEKRPEVVPAPAVRQALDRLATPAEGEEHGPLGWPSNEDSPRPTAYRVAVAALGVQGEEELYEEAVQLIQTGLGAVAWDEGLVERVVERSGAILDQLGSYETSRCSDIAQSIVDNWQNYPTTLWERLVGLFGQLLRQSPEERRGDLSNGLAAQIFSSPDRGTELLDDMKGQVPEQLVSGIVERLTAVAETHAANRERATAILREINPDDLGARLRGVIVRAMQEQQYESAQTVLATYRDVLSADQLTAIAEDTLNRPARRASASGSLASPRGRRTALTADRPQAPENEERRRNKRRRLL
jgi:hypothetical protein